MTISDTNQFGHDAGSPPKPKPQQHPMIELTKDRLEEARFFLGHLRRQKTAQAQPSKPPSEHFRYYLNAFINAARSVAWVLRKEETDKYKAWIGSWEAQRTEAENALLRLTKEMRNTSVKQGFIHTTVRSEEVPIAIAPPRQPNALRAYALSLRHGGGPWTISDIHYVQLNGSEQEVVAVCEGYLEHLTKLVQDFIDKASRMSVGRRSRGSVTARAPFGKIFFDPPVFESIPAGLRIRPERTRGICRNEPLTAGRNDAYSQLLSD